MVDAPLFDAGLLQISRCIFSANQSGNALPPHRADIARPMRRQFHALLSKT
jgi:hypothetical protein